MADITSNLVAHWKLDETSGTIAADSSGNGHTGTYVNTPTLGVTGAFGNSKAVTFTKAEFEYVSLGSKSATAAITVACWLKRTDEIAIQRFINWGKTMIEVNAAGTAILWYPSIGSGATTFAVSPLGTGWNHIVLAQTGTTATLYVNGAPIGSASPLAVSTTAGTSFLAVFNVTNQLLNGTLDDVRIYSRALSAADVAALYAYTGAAKAAKYNIFCGQKSRVRS